MTPWQIKICAKAAAENQEIEHDHKVWIMWHTAALFRSAKKLPPMDKFMSGAKKAPVKSIDENAILERLKAYKARYDNENKKAADK